MSGIAALAAGDFRWPPIGGASGVPGVPPGVLDVNRIYSCESWLGETLSPSSREGYVTVNVSGYVVAAASPDPADTVTLRFLQATLTANPAGAPSGQQRQGTLAIPPDGFGSDPSEWRTLIWRGRMGPTTTIPTAVNDYLAIPGGWSNQPAGNVEPTEGEYFVFDRTLGVDSWVLRAARAGVRIQKSFSLAYDNAIHVLGMVHMGTEIRIFKDGVWLAGSLVGPEIQPSANVNAKAHHLTQLAATLGINPQIQTDHLIWGPIA